MIFGLNPWAIIGAGVLAIALTVGAYFKGDADAANRYQIKIDKMVTDQAEAVQQAKQAMLIQSANASAALEAGNAKREIVYRTITKNVDRIVERPVYSGVCFDDDGLRLANAALAGIAVEAADPGKPEGPMPGIVAPQ